ncbi:MAG: cutinase family protein [Rhodococcus sp. (in: high G+C Gram-positive bacteria)]|uniref:cutinase family protein n=1 Tax=Rhodococcus sp. TaxID=1831 RepID=UPI003BAF2F92
MLRSMSARARQSGGTVAAAALLIVMSGPGFAVAAPDTDRVDPNNFAASCPDLLIVAVPGASDTTEDRNPLDDGERKQGSDWVANVTVPAGERYADEPGTVGWMYVPYPATYGVDLFEEVPTYEESMAAGVASMNKILDDNKSKCGDATGYVLLGYSVGAEVVERVARDLGHRDSSALVTADDIAGVALIGDPLRPAGTPSMGEPGPSGGGFVSSEPADYGALADEIVYACRPTDISCDAPQEIAVLELAVAVLGRMHFTLLNPSRTVSDFEEAVARMASRAIAHIVTRHDWFASDESFLDVLRKVSDETYDPDGPDEDTQVSREQMIEALNWAMGPGSDVVQAKLRDEGRGFVEDNSDIFEFVTKPYVFLGYMQHLSYWNNDPNDSSYWESERIVDWITDLARAEKAHGAGGPPPDR